MNNDFSRVLKVFPVLSGWCSLGILSGWWSLAWCGRDDKSPVFSWLSILSGRQGSSFSAQHPRRSIPERFFSPLLTISDQNITQETHPAAVKYSLPGRYLLAAGKTMERLVPICLDLGNLIDPQGESHLRIPQYPISWKAPLSIVICKQWDWGQLLGRKIQSTKC